MEVLLVLLFAAAAVGGGVAALVLGVVAFNRTSRHASALGAALARIQQLEARLAATETGAVAPPVVAPTPMPAPTPAPAMRKLALVRPSVISPAVAPLPEPEPAPQPTATTEPTAPKPEPAPAKEQEPVVAAAPEPTPEPVAEATLEPEPEPVAATPEPTPQPDPKPAVATAPEPVAQPTPEPAVAAAPEPELEPTPEKQPEPEPAAAARVVEEPAAAEAPAAPMFPRPAPRTLSRTRKPAGFEQALTGNWFVWIGAALIALAIVSFVSYAAAQGWYGPRAQIATAFGFSLIALAASEWVKQRPPVGLLAESQLKHLPAILAALGLFGLFATGWAGATIWRDGVQGATLVPPPAAFAILAASGLAAVILSLRHGPWFAALGLAGGYLAPALIPSQQASPAILYGYLTALTVAALAIIHMRGWRPLIWFASAGALLWGIAGASFLAPTHPLAYPAAGAYALALALIAALFAADQAKAPLQLASFTKPSPGWSDQIVAAFAVSAVSAILLLVIATNSGHDGAVMTVLIAFLAMMIGLSVWRPGFAPLALGAALTALAAIYLWPRLENFTPNTDLVLGFVPMFQSAAAMGFLMSVGGWLMMMRGPQTWPGATLAAIGPLGVLIGVREIGDGFGPPLLWAAAAGGLAILNASTLMFGLRGRNGEAPPAGAAAAFSLGAAGAAALTPVYLLDGIWAPTALAVLLPAFAFAERRYNLPALKFAAALVGLGVVIWLTFPGFVFTYAVGQTPVFNALLPAYGVAIVSFVLAARLFDRTKGRDDARIVQGLEVGALVLGAAFLSMEVRHIANAGFLGAPYNSLGEAGGHTLAWLGLALGLAARFGPRPRPLLFWAEMIAFAGALAHAVLMAVVMLNPWWGLEPPPAPGAPIFNVLLAAYGLPALLLGAYAMLRQSQNMPDRARIAGIAAIGFGFLWVTLEVRRAFHGETGMAGAGYMQLEAWAYTAVWIGFALTLLGLGLLGKRPALRYASLGVLMAAVVKAFLFDMAALEGWLRIASFLGLGVTIIGVALFYQRVVFPRADRVNVPALDPTPQPAPPPANS